MSSGGGKGGKKTTETALPDWLRGPADRNLQRAEAVQQIEYMPYYGPDVAGFNPTQQAAMGTNVDTARAFGLLGDNYLNLTPLSGMPEPTEYAGGFTGYSSQPLYEQALAELKANQPGAVEQYDALFGNQVPANNFGGGGGRFRGTASFDPIGSPQPNQMDSGLDDLNNMNFTFDPLQYRNQVKQEANFVSNQNRTPTTHAPIRRNNIAMPGGIVDYYGT